MASPLEAILTVAADVFQVSRKDLAPASSPDTVEGWDSVAHLNLVMAVEAQFSVTFEPDEIAAMSDLGAIARILESKLPNHAPGSAGSR